MTIARKPLPELTPVQVHDTWEAVARSTELARLLYLHGGLQEHLDRYNEWAELRAYWYELDKQNS